LYVYYWQIGHWSSHCLAMVCSHGLKFAGGTRLFGCFNKHVELGQNLSIYQLYWANGMNIYLPAILRFTRWVLTPSHMKIYTCDGKSQFFLWLNPQLSSWKITKKLMSNIAMDQSNLVRWFVQMLIPYEYPHSPKIGYSHEKSLWINKNDASAPYRSPSWEILHGFTIAPQRNQATFEEPLTFRVINNSILLDFGESDWILVNCSGSYGFLVDISRIFMDVCCF
jgi:hypothetical protein